MTNAFYGPTGNTWTGFVQAQPFNFRVRPSSLDCGPSKLDKVLFAAPNGQTDTLYVRLAVLCRVSVTVVDCDNILSTFSD